jgi:hypothetical protein
MVSRIWNGFGLQMDLTIGGRLLEVEEEDKAVGFFFFFFFFKKKNQKYYFKEKC